MRITQYANYPICQLPNMPITQYANYPICQLPNMRITQYANYPIFQLPSMPITLYTNYPIFNTPDFFRKSCLEEGWKIFPRKLCIFLRKYTSYHTTFFLVTFFLNLLSCAAGKELQLGHTFSPTTSPPTFLHSTLYYRQ